MVQLGRDLKDKHLSKVEKNISQWLDNNEAIIGLFQISRIRPQSDGILLTNRRVLTIAGLRIGEFKIVDEIVADEVLELTLEKGLGKSIKLFVTKKNGERLYVGSGHNEDAHEIQNLLPSMSGTAQPISKKIGVINEERQKAEQEHKQKLKEDRLMTKQKIKEDRRKSKQKNKEDKAARIAARGNMLGYVRVKYMGGYNPEDKKTFFPGKLSCFENEVQFPDKSIVIPADQITGFEITGNQQTNSRISVTRMVTLGIFSLAAPKRSTKKEASIYIQLKDGRQVFFHTNELSESDVHRKLANAISHYSSLQASQDNQSQSPTAHSSNVAEAIKQFSDLKKQGIITDEEFEAKKKQLLDL